MEMDFAPTTKEDLADEVIMSKKAEEMLFKERAGPVVPQSETDKEYRSNRNAPRNFISINGTFKFLKSENFVHSTQMAIAALKIAESLSDTDTSLMLEYFASILNLFLIAPIKKDPDGICLELYNFLPARFITQAPHKTTGRSLAFSRFPIQVKLEDKTVITHFSANLYIRMMYTTSDTLQSCLIKNRMTLKEFPYLVRMMMLQIAGNLKERMWMVDFSVSEFVSEACARVNVTPLPKLEMKKLKDIDGPYQNTKNPNKVKKIPVAVEIDTHVPSAPVQKKALTSGFFGLFTKN